MRLSEWIAQQPRGAKAELARATGIRFATIQYLCDGEHNASFPLAELISTHTGGAVTVAELCSSRLDPTRIAALRLERADSRARKRAAKLKLAAARARKRALELERRLDRERAVAAARKSTAKRKRALARSNPTKPTKPTRAAARRR